jgi:predicted nucleic acid-binding protein
VGVRELKASVDAGPLIHLTEIGCLRFLNGFDALHVPDAIWFETVSQDRISQTDLLNVKNIQRHTLSKPEVEEFVNENNLSALHAGEQECLFVCMSENISVILTDDMAVRDVARRHHIVPVGSLGIVVSAFRRKEITLQEAECYIGDLHEVSSLFVTRAIVELAIKQLRSVSK